MALFVIGVGPVGFAFLTASFTSVINASDDRDRLFRQKMLILSRFLQTVKLPPRLSKRVLKKLTWTWRLVEPKDMEWRDILSDLPQALRHEVCRELYKDIIQKSKWFQAFNEYPAFVSELTNALRPVHFVEGHKIYRRGDVVSEWYIVDSGTISMRYENATTYLKEGDTFGEIGIMLTGLSPVSVECVTDCRLFSVSKSDMISIMDDLVGETNHEQVKKVVRELAKKKLELLKQLAEKQEHKEGNTNDDFNEDNFLEIKSPSPLRQQSLRDELHDKNSSGALSFDEKRLLMQIATDLGKVKAAIGSMQK